MYIYNVTINIDQNIQKEWLLWMKSQIIEVLKTGKFTTAKLTQVLVEDETTVTYSVQYTAKSRKYLDDYYKFDATTLRNKGQKKFADKMLSFRTELKIIEEFSL